MTFAASIRSVSIRSNLYAHSDIAPSSGLAVSIYGDVWRVPVGGVSAVSAARPPGSVSGVWPSLLRSLIFWVRWASDGATVAATAVPGSSSASLYRIAVCYAR